MPFSTRDFEGRVAIVTGAARGLGRAVAARLHERGASVVVNVRDQARADAAADALGDRAIGIAGDVTAPGFPEALARGALDRFGRIDILINNAALARSTRLPNLTADEFYSANLAEEVKKGMRMKVLKGGWAHKPPRGYRIESREGHSLIVPDREVSSVIREAFRSYAAGDISLRDVRLQLADAGVRTPSGKPLPVSSVNALLRNPFYAGRVRWHQEEFDGRHEALVTPETFGRVQRILTMRAHDSGEKGRLHFLMRGVAVCAECGARMTAERHKRWSYYRCISNTQDRGLCAARFSNVEKAHEQLRGLYAKLRIPAALKARVEAEARKLVAEHAATAVRDVRSVQMRRAKLLEREAAVSEAFAAGDVSLNAYRRAVRSIQQRLGAVARILASRHDPKTLVERVSSTLRLAESIRDVDRELSERGRQRLLRLVFKRMTLDEGRIVDFALRPPFDALFQREEADGDDGRHLEDRQVRSTIQSILEFDVPAIVDVELQSKAA